MGSGFFHASRITTAVSGFSFVYDCGSKGARSPQRADVGARIGDLAARGGRVDAIFISHFHVDHVSGVAALIRRFSPGQVFIPYTDVFDRLAAYAESLDVPGALTGEETAFYRALIANPVATLLAQSDAIQVVRIGVGERRDDGTVADGVGDRVTGTGWHASEADGVLVSGDGRLGRVS